MTGLGTRRQSVRAWVLAVTLAFVAPVAVPCASAGQIAPAPAGAQEAGASLQLRYTATFPQSALSFGERSGYDTVSLAGADFTGEAGKPMLPAKTIRIALPAGMAATSVRVDSAQAMTLAGRYNIYPAQPPKPIADLAERPGFVPPHADIYASPAAYPGKLAELSHRADLAGQAIAFVRLYPVQYLPADRELKLYTSITIILEGVGGHEYGDVLPTNISIGSLRSYEKMLREAVVNPEAVKLSSPIEPAPVTRGVGPGQYDYVIITSSGWVDDFQPLADWRTQTGIPSTIVTTDWIYNDGGYVGTDVEKVRAFVQDAHSNWGATCFLLAGDTNVIPSHIRTITIPGYWTDDIPNDAYYADYDEDWVCEVNVGRASVRNLTQINTFIDKLFTYEKDPPSVDYATTAAFFGFDITDPGDGYGENSKESIRGLHMPVSWTLDTEYDSEPGAHKADVIGYLNQGYHLVNHHDHCNTSSMGAGWISHGDLLGIPDINALSNGDRQSILFAVGCNPCDIPAVTSIAEAFVRNANGGGLAFMGNSRTGWGGPPEDPNHYSALQDLLLYRCLFDDGYERLGECFTVLKNDAFDPVDPYNVNKYCFTQLHLLGDPGMPVWTEEPQTLSVTHAANLTVGAPMTFPVEVYCGGSPVEGATVCLLKDSDVYEVETTSGGLATFHFAPSTTGTMLVTVTCHNYLPYEGSATVRSNGDFDDDGDVDLGDFSIFGQCFGGADNPPAAGCPPGVNADLDGDGDVDLGDFAIFGQNFTGAL